MKSFTERAARCLVAATALIAAVALSIPTAVPAADYPSRGITIVVPLGVGGALDSLSRQFGRQLGKILSADVNVENKTGGSGTIGIGVVVQARPDGYTIGSGANSALCYQPLVDKDLAYKTPDDYMPIIKLGSQYQALAVRADAPWKNFAEFMADVRKKPGKIRAATHGKRTMPDLSLELLNKAAGVKIVTVPFTGGVGDSVIALLGGRVEAYAASPLGIIGQVRAGKVRVLAMFKKGKFETFPDATPVADAGYDAALPSSFYMIAPKGMPKDVQDKLVAASLQVVRSEEFIKYLKANDFEGDTSGPEGVKAELVQFTKTFAELNKFLGDQK